MHGSEATLLGQMITESKRDIRRDIRDLRGEVRHLTKRVVTMEKSRSTGPDITAMEKWIVRGATIGLPTATFLLTGSWEKAVQLFLHLAK